ncbi:hypothetical protein BI334_18415 [Moorena producens 3L]|nr:hypothetical protein BI334_18415 [Moorena producens 3L]
MAIAIALPLLLSIAVSPGLTEDLPLPDPEFNGTIEETYDKSEADYNTLLGPQTPEDAPNILLVGIAYNTFHTTAIISIKRRIRSLLWPTYIIRRLHFLSGTLEKS